MSDKAKEDSVDYARLVSLQTNDGEDVTVEAFYLMAAR